MTSQQALWFWAIFLHFAKAMAYLLAGKYEDAREEWSEAGANKDEILESVQVFVAIRGTTGIAESLRVI